VITTWNDILPDAIRSLTPLHQEIVLYIMNLPGRRKPSGVYATKTWNLSREQFFNEFEYTVNEIRRYLEQQGLSGPGVLRLE
jgi:hypothetical protein